MIRLRVPLLALPLFLAWHKDASPCASASWNSLSFDRMKVDDCVRWGVRALQQEGYSVTPSGFSLWLQGRSYGHSALQRAASVTIVLPPCSSTMPLGSARHWRTASTRKPPATNGIAGVSALTRDTAPLPRAVAYARGSVRNRERKRAARQRRQSHGRRPGGLSPDGSPLARRRTNGSRRSDSDRGVRGARDGGRHPGDVRNVTGRRGDSRRRRGRRAASARLSPAPATLKHR